MNTLIEAAPARTDARPAAHTTASAPAVARPAHLGLRLIGAAVAVAAILHAVFVIVFAPQWPVATNLVELSSLAIPLGMIALGVAMWRTAAAPAAVLAPMIGAFALVTAVSVAEMTTDVRFFVEDLEMWSMLAALGAHYVVALAVLARGTWRGILRVLPVIAASWGPVVLVVILIVGESASWETFVLYLAGGTALTGLALAVRPQLTGAELTR